jgi:hypothetical protein
MNPQQANNNPVDETPSKRIRLPRPDAENITVLTRELPNEPILPWHRFDSPWIQPESEGDDADAESQEMTDKTDADAKANANAKADITADTDPQSADTAQLSIFDLLDETSSEDARENEGSGHPGMEFLNYDHSRDG